MVSIAQALVGLVYNALDKVRKWLLACGPGDGPEGLRKAVFCEVSVSLHEVVVA